MMIEPDYYKSEDGQDLLDHFENGLLPNQEEVRGFYRGSAMKYIRRYDLKGGIEDLDKAITYLQRLKAYEQKLQGEKSVKADIGVVIHNEN